MLRVHPGSKHQLWWRFKDPRDIQRFFRVSVTGIVPACHVMIIDDRSVFISWVKEMPFATGYILFQHAALKAVLFHKQHHLAGRYLLSFHPEYAVAILEVKVYFMAGKMPVKQAGDPAGISRFFNIGCEYFHHKFN
jgi:hypothetical protein